MVGALIAAVAQGRGGVLVIEGPPGIGKSRLLTEILAVAEKAGVRALFGEAFEYQQTVPFFSLFMATLNADPPVGDVEVLRRLGGSADLRYWVVHHLADAIHARAAQTPWGIALKDIHWPDNGTHIVNDARDAYPTGSSFVRRMATHAFARAASQRDDVHDAMRRLGGDVTLLGTPLTPEILDLVILGARMASAAGGAGLRARVLQAIEALERERPPVPLFAGVAEYPRGNTPT